MQNCTISDNAVVYASGCTVTDDGSGEYGFANSWGIWCPGLLTIEGDAQVTASGGEVNSTVSSGSFGIDINLDIAISGGTILARGGNYAIFVNETSGTTLDLTGASISGDASATAAESALAAAAVSSNSSDSGRTLRLGSGDGVVARTAKIAFVQAHDHSWGGKWSNNSRYHWHNCTAAGCPVTANSGKFGYGEHDYSGDADLSCNVCGYWRELEPDPDGDGAEVAEYTLKFNTNGGDRLKSVTKEAGTRINLDKYVPQREGYEFDGWYEDKKLTEPVSSVKLREDVTVYAKWTKIDAGWYNPYRDLREGDWFYGYIRDLSVIGVVNGYPDGSFRPQGLVSYGEALKLIMTAAGYGYQAPNDWHWASGYLARAQAGGLIGPVADLNAPIDRLDVAQVAAQALGLRDSATASVFADTGDAAVLALYAAGVVEGSLDAAGRRWYYPHSNIGRAELAAVVWRIQQYESNR